MRFGPALRNTGKIAFHIDGEDRRTLFGNSFRQDLQGDSFTYPGCAGDEAVAIGLLEPQFLPYAIRIAADENRLTHSPLSYPSRPGD